VYYRSIFDTVRDLLHDEAFYGHEKIMSRYLKPDLLILDDMGMKALPKRSGEFLFEIIMRRHELKSTLMTSNRPLEDWGKLIGDVPAATHRGQGNRWRGAFRPLRGSTRRGC
jgi:DNA replication protein DnaC